MKIRVHRSKISDKPYKKFAFPQYTRKQAEEAGGTITKASLERASAAYPEDAVTGFYVIRHFKEIAARMRSDPEKFGRCLNKLISTYTEIVRTDNGVAGKFFEVGAPFAFPCGSKPTESAKNALIAVLRMRYIINKLNRTWNFYRDDSWQIGFGLDFGTIELEELREMDETFYRISGRPKTIAKGIGLSAGSSQIIITDSMYLRFPFLETAFDIKSPRHVPVSGEDFSSKIREIVGIVGPQSKKIYEIFI